MQRFAKLLSILAVALLAQGIARAETVGIFADTTTGQIQFAVGDVKTALQARGFSVETLPLSSLSTSYAKKKIVIALATSTAAAKVLTAQGAALPTALGEQAYALATTKKPSISYWALGGDANGAMYGGLQLAENLQFYGFDKTYDNQVSPGILRRGAKLNLAFDKRLPTYAGSRRIDLKSDYNFHTSGSASIKAVWDMSFWTEWIDEQARNRYNVLSVWVHNPFPALVRVPGYEKATLPYILGDTPDFREDKNLTLEKRIAFWRGVIKYAHERGFTFYFFNWNVCPDYASEQYKNITGEQTNEATMDYYNKSIKALLETYPELDGFGISAGDHTGSDKEVNAAWTYKAYGKGVYEYAKANPKRDFTFIHRLLKVDYKDVRKNWGSVMALPNVQFDCSIKYCMAYTYSTTSPTWGKGALKALEKEGGATWLTLRNDGFFYSDFGDPKFVRDFIGNLPSTNYPDGAHQGKPRLRGVYLGHDAYAPTRSYLYKNEALNNNDSTKKPMLEIQRKWYMEKLWGRIAYDRNTSDEVFIRHLALRFPQLPSDRLFAAWAKASRSQPKLVELVQGTWKLDSHFYTEASMWRNDGENYFRSIKDMAETEVADGSEDKLASISETAAGKVNGRKSSYALADEIETDAMDALKLLSAMKSGGSPRADVLLKDVQQQAFLSAYYAYKIRGATHLKAGKKADARDAMSKAYGWWMHYANSMESTYKPDRFRTYDLSKIGWHFYDRDHLKEFSDLGGVGTPALPALPVSAAPGSKARENERR